MSNYEYSTNQLNSTGDTTRGLQIFRWDHESYQTETGETAWKCKYVLINQLTAESVTAAIAEKYPEIDDIESIMGEL